MTNKEAYKRAMSALEAANADQGNAYVQNGFGWGDMDSSDIFSHIAEYLAHAFKQGPKPAPLEADNSHE